MLRNSLAFAASSFAGIVLGSMQPPAAPEFPSRGMPYADLGLQRGAVGDAGDRIDDPTVTALWGGKHPVLVARADRSGG